MSAYILIFVVAAVAADDVLSFSFLFVCCCCCLFVCLYVVFLLFLFLFIYCFVLLLLSLSCLDFLLGSVYLEHTLIYTNVILSCTS